MALHSRFGLKTFLLVKEHFNGSESEAVIAWLMGSCMGHDEMLDPNKARSEPPFRNVLWMQGKAAVIFVFSHALWVWGEEMVRSQET